MTKRKNNYAFNYRGFISNYPTLFFFRTKRHKLTEQKNGSNSVRYTIFEENMENIIESEKAERDDVCGCKEGEGNPTLGVLKDVQRAYEDRIEAINRAGGPKKLQVSFLSSKLHSLMFFLVYTTLLR